MKVFDEVLCPAFCIIQNRFVSSFRILVGIKKLFFGKKTPHNNNSATNSLVARKIS